MHVLCRFFKPYNVRPRPRLIVFLLLILPKFDDNVSMGLKWGCPCPDWLRCARGAPYQSRWGSVRERYLGGGGVGRQIVRANAASFSIPPYVNGAKISVPPYGNTWKIWVPPQQVTQNGHFPVFIQLF